MNQEELNTLVAQMLRELAPQPGGGLGLKLPVCGAICGVLHQILLPQVNF